MQARQITNHAYILFKMPIIKNATRHLLPIVDILLLPIVFLSGLFLKAFRRIGAAKLPACRMTLLRVGVFPIRSHYYEPLLKPNELRNPLDQRRPLPGINLNENSQIDLISRFTFSNEFVEFISGKNESKFPFKINNNSFSSGDAEFFYNLLRLKKPRFLIEIGSGNSTLVAARALEANRTEDPRHTCKHICIEPYEMPWLEQLGVTVIRSKVESINIDVFKNLSDNDILFIDSSHVIRPQGDVLFEYLQLLPILNSGVIVHIHDIFTPRDYLEHWVTKDIRLWNEQYLFEAFMTHNNRWEIIAGVNYLKNNHYQLAKKHLPFLTEDRQPGSMYIRKVS